MIESSYLINVVYSRDIIIREALSDNELTKLSFFDLEAMLFPQLEFELPQMISNMNIFAREDTFSNYFTYPTQTLLLPQLICFYLNFSLRVQFFYRD